MDDLNDLRLALRSRFPLVIVESHEEAKVRKLVEKAARADARAIREFTPFFQNLAQ